MELKRKKRFSIVVPVYKNEENIEESVHKMMSYIINQTRYDMELIMVCDGSPDRSFEIMKEMKDKYPDYMKIATFTKNFGQGAAVHCGLEMAVGDVVGVISCDLQDPIELFTKMLKKWEEGYKLVIAVREGRNDSFFTKCFSTMFHFLVHSFVNTNYPKGGFDFYLMDREVVESFCKVDMANGSTQMLLIWLGYDYYKFSYSREKREKGKSSWNFSRKVNAAIGLLVTYSHKTFQIVELFGLLILIGWIAESIFCVANAMKKGLDIYLVIISIQLLIGGILIFGIGVVGEYIWRIYDNSLKHPRYVIKEKEI